MQLRFALRVCFGAVSAAGVAAACAAFVACGPSSDGTGATAPTERGPNLLLISIDTLRADHLGFHGYGRDTSPVLDDLARRAFVYENAYAPAPWTLPSHAAMLTGRHPLRAGIRDIDSRIAPGVAIVAEPLRAVGYQTAAFVDSTPKAFVGGKRGFSRGFDRYEHAPHGSTAWRRHDMARTVEAAHAWLVARDPTRPFFLFLHTKTVHSLRDDESRRVPADSPYDAPEPFRWRFAPDAEARGTAHVWSSGTAHGPRYLMELNERIVRGSDAKEVLPRPAVAELVARYDAGIAYVDHQIGVLLAHLRTLDLARDTVLIVTSDHGEGFLDHRFFLHKELHREILHVPLLVFDPRAGSDRLARRVAAPVRLEDVAPTLLDFAGLRAAAADGRVLPRSGDPVLDQPALFAAAKQASDEFYEGFSLRDGRWTLIRDRVQGEAFSLRLYDSTVDPLERAPLAGEQERAKRMEKRLLDWFERAEASAPGASQIELGEDAIDELKALGYIE